MTGIIGRLTFGLRATLFLVAAMPFAGCGGSSTPETLIGEWQVERDCTEIVQKLADAGLERFTLEVIATAEMVPGVVNDPTLFKDPEHPCEGASPTKHSHFFTAEGQFGSRNEFGAQVDTGTYEIVDDDTFVLGNGQMFNYHLEGDTIMFEPVLPDDCSTEQCHENAVLAVSVAFPGLTWERVG